MPDDFEGDPEDLDVPPSFFPYEAEEILRERDSMGEPVEVTIDGVFAAESRSSIQRFVLLSDGPRKLPILIGPYEAQAITLPLEGSRPDRPMTHDLIKIVLDRVDAALDRIVIDDLWNTTYYAKLYIRTGEEEMEIDCRPSDAIALAVRFNARIFVSDGILEQATE